MQLPDLVFNALATPRKRRCILLCPLFLVTLAPAFSQPRAVISNVTRDEKAAEACRPFIDDALRVEIFERSTKLGELTFCSAYGKATTNIVTDGAGVSYLLLRVDTVHGTNARTEYLRIYRAASPLDEYAQIPISGPSGAITHWEYGYTVTPLPHRGVRIVLTLLPDSIPESANQLADSVRYGPPDTVRVVDIGADLGT